MNDFEYNYTPEKQQQGREYYAELCQGRANSHLVNAERNEKRGDVSYANTCRSLAIFDAKRKKEWLEGDYYETLGKTLRFFLPNPKEVTEDSMLVEAIIDVLLENLHNEEVFGSRYPMEDDFRYLKEYSRSYTRSWKVFAERMREDNDGIIKFLVRRKEKRGVQFCEEDIEEFVYKATKAAWYNVLEAWFNYKQWRSEKED